MSLVCAGIPELVTKEDMDDRVGELARGTVLFEKIVTLMLTYVSSRYGLHNRTLYCELYKKGGR